MTDQANIDMNYRPSSYWPEAANREQRLSRIHGKARRDITRQALEVGGVAELNGIGPEIARESLSEVEVQAWGRIHPSHMGGKFLPGYGASDVEIARISLQSTTADQISVRARGHDGEIHYLVVDEYESDYELPVVNSLEPLTLAELITLLDQTVNPFNDAGGGLVRNHWFFNVEFMEPEEVVDFVSVGSAFYPDLGLYYEGEAEDWLAEQEVGEEEPPFRYRHPGAEQGVIPLKFKVLVDDNFHYQDESERYEHGEFETWEEAVAACKAMVDSNLGNMSIEGKSAAELYCEYTSFGDDPYIRPVPAGERFSAWDYANQRCEELCTDG